MKTQATLTSIRQHGDEMSIHQLQRIHRTEIIGDVPTGLPPAYRDVAMNSWCGTTIEGHPVHLVFHAGELTIEVDLPTASGGSKPLTVMRWNPLRVLPLLERLIEQEIKHKSPRKEDPPVPSEPLPGTDPNAQSADMRAFHARHDGILDEAQLIEWLVLHNKHFNLLTSHGLAGSRIRFRTLRRFSNPIAA